MIAKQLPFNPVLAGMAYAGERLTLTFKKKQGNTQDRTYSGVPQTIAYTLYYKRTAEDVMSYFANHIKGKFKVVKIK